MKRSLWDALPRTLLTWLACVALAAGLGALLHLDCRAWLTAPVLLAWCAALAAAEYFGRFWAALALWTASLGSSLLLADRDLLLAAARAALARAALARTGTADGYGTFCLLLFCAAAALPLSFLLRVYGGRAALSLGWAALWLLAALREWSVPRIVPAALLPLLLLTLVDTIRRFRDDPEPSGTLKRALLLSLLPAAVLLAVLPTPAEPYGYPLLHAIAEKAEQLWYDAETALRYRREGSGQFSLSFNGVSDEAELGGAVEADDVRILLACPQFTPDGALYLFGNAWDRFDGHGWGSALEPRTREPLKWRYDTAERLYAVWRLLHMEGTADVEFGDFFRENSVYLSYRNMNVRTMFHVLNTTYIYTDAQRYPYADTPTGVLFDYVQQNDTWYRAYYLEPNARTLGALIAASEGTDYGTRADGPLWNLVSWEFGYGMELREDIDLEEIFAERAELIRAAYLDTEGVSARARALAEEITAGCGGDFEKLAAIAAYLQKNYSYTLRPGAVPEDANFLDWLLFEGREGYCTWYATAATLLARSVGVPARYVQGYRCELPDTALTPVGPENAHAWCEGYVAGYGWVTVEATPGFGSGGVGWLTAAEERELHADEPDAPLPDDAPPVEDEGKGRELPGVNGHGGAAEEPEPESEPERNGRLAALIPAVLAAALLAAWLAAWARKKKRYAESDAATRLRVDLERLLRCLSAMGYPRRSEESLRQFFGCLPWYCLPASEKDAEKMIALYERTFFALTQPSEEELEAHRAFAACFRPRTLRQRFRYWTGA